MSHPKKVRFFEKPRCAGNARQKALLRSAGHEVVEVSLLDHPFTEEELRSFFGTHPVAEWLNPRAPRMKSGEIDVERLDENAALSAMLEDRLLIRRPLMEVEGTRISGFDVDALERIGVSVKESQKWDRLSGQNLEACPSEGRTQAPESAGKMDAKD